MASDDESVSSSGEPDLEIRKGKSAIIFLIDTQPSMLSKAASTCYSDQANLTVAIHSCRSIMLKMMQTGQKDLLGVVFMGTEKPDPKSEKKNITLFLELNYPSTESLKVLDDLLKDQDYDMFRELYGTTNDILLADALWFCSSLFSKTGVKLDSKRVLLFTDNHDPHSMFPDLAHMARTRAKDLNKMDIALELYPMSADFQYNQFYKEVINIVNGPTDYVTVNTCHSLEELVEQIERSDFRSKRYSKLKWDIGGGVFVGISLHSIYRVAKVQPLQPLDRATNEPVKRVKQTFDQGTVELLLPDEMEECVEVAGEELSFSRQDREMIRQIMEPGLTFLGFKPASWASVDKHCGQASFAFPDENRVEGSNNLMKGLVNTCISREKVMMCCITPRHRALTKYVCLLPSEEVYSSAGKQISALGFHIIPFPFYDEARDLSLERSPSVAENKVDIAKKLISKLKFSYDPTQFKNPKLQKFWTYLEALALDSNVSNNIEDSTMPDENEQAARLDNLTNEFKSAFDISGSSSTATKRSSTSRSSAEGSKRSRNADHDSDNVNEDIKAAIALKKVEKFTVAQLKEFLVSQRKSVSGMKKADLVKAVYSLKF